MCIYNLDSTCVAGYTRGFIYNSRFFKLPNRIPTLVTIDPGANSLLGFGSELSPLPNQHKHRSKNSCVVLCRCFDNKKSGMVVIQEFLIWMQSLVDIV